MVYVSSLCWLQLVQILTGRMDHVYLIGVVLHPATLSGRTGFCNGNPRNFKTPWVHERIEHGRVRSKITGVLYGTGKPFAYLFNI
jgi:hypothetical protein